VILEDGIIYFVCWSPTFSLIDLVPVMLRLFFFCILSLVW